ncbi:hypothetical protein Clacol_008542 [Clathrus columnatus]|uniref:F-box domain-containing protein n=1 Tax=Clathrus columnatus TaxID=1419009 RepID=A0AAV5ANN4_9AGAM|nr:hypothetical protein Clacol_008542 [Clathrus columnatus]
MNFPPELFLHIIHQIDQPKDLLSLALTNRIFCTTIIPDHMDYRQIWCEVDKDEVWNHLLEQRSRCQAIRTLIVDNSEKRYIPRRCYDEFKSNNISDPSPGLGFRRMFSQQKFCEALSRMSNLRTLKCALSDEDVAKRVVNGISRSGCVLDQFEVVVGRRLEDQELDESPFRFEIMSPHLNSLSKFTVYAQIFAKIDTKSMMQTLSNMPNLTYLKLTCPTISLPQFLTIGRWPKLKALTLQLASLKDEEDGDDGTYTKHLRAFFTRHPRLESLDFYGTLLPGCMYDSKDFLPRLTAFRNDYYQVFPIGTILPITVSRNLTHLTVFVAPERFNLKPGALNALKSCNLHCDKDIRILQDFVNAAPNIQKLCLHYRRFHLSLSDILRCLMSLTKLTYLLGPLNNISLSEQQGAALLPELYKFPSLSYIDVKVGNERRCARLLPNHLRKTMDYEVLSLSELRPDEFLRWGDFF